MNHAPGRCSNVDYCAVADSRLPIETPSPGVPGQCPECSKPLYVPAAKAPGVMLPVLAGIGVLAVSGGGLYAGLAALHTAHAAVMHATVMPFAAARATAPPGNTPSLPRPTTPPANNAR